MKLVKRTEIEKPPVVYNLHVQNNHNYLANGTVVSNCHGLRGPVLQKLVCDNASKIPYRFGVTGTLPKDPSEKMLVHIAAGPIRFEIPAHELISRKVLSSVQIDIVQLEEDLTKEYNEFLKEIKFGVKPTYTQFKDGYFTDFSAEKSYLQRKKSRIEFIADMIMAKCDNSGNALVLIGNIAMCRKIAALIPGSILVNGQDVADPVKRQVVYDMFKTRNDLIVLATPNIAGTGLSIDRIFNIITVDIGKSFIRIIQAIGRGLRKSDDKSHVSHTDICSDLKYGKKHLAERVKFYKEAKYPHKKYVIDYNKECVEI